MLVYAHSAPPGPLKTLSHPSTLSLEIVPRVHTLDESRTLRHSDTFRLIISAFGSNFNLHLRPNDHLVHPAARIHHFSGSSVVDTKPLLRESVKAYWGEVIEADYSDERLREDAAGVVPPPPSHPSVLGWARIVVHHQGDIKQNIAII